MCLCASLPALLHHLQVQWALPWAGTAVGAASSMHHSSGGGGGGSTAGLLGVPWIIIRPLAAHAALLVGEVLVLAKLDNWMDPRFSRVGRWLDVLYGYVVVKGKGWPTLELVALLHSVPPASHPSVWPQPCQCSSCLAAEAALQLQLLSAREYCQAPLSSADSVAVQDRLGDMSFLDNIYRRVLASLIYPFTVIQMVSWCIPGFAQLAAVMGTAHCCRNVLVADVCPLVHRPCWPRVLQCLLTVVPAFW
jgi:hypothetical protein